MAGQAFLSRREWLLLGTLMIVVSSLTVAERERLIPLSDLASSPHAIAEARLWSLVTSALLVSSPLFWSLASFQCEPPACPLPKHYKRSKEPQEPSRTP